MILIASSLKAELLSVEEIFNSLNQVEQSTCNGETLEEAKQEKSHSFQSPPPLSLAEFEELRIRSKAEAEAERLKLYQRELEALLADVEDFEDFDVERRRELAKALEGHKGARALEATLLLSKDEDAAVRLRAAHNLGDYLDSEAFKALLVMARDGDPGVRMAVANALGNHENPESLKALIILARDSDENVRFVATKALGRQQDPKALEALLFTLIIGDNNDGLLQAAVAALGFQKDPRVLPILLYYAKSPDPSVRDEATFSILNYQGPGALEAHLSLATDTDPFVRAKVAKALGHHQDPRSLEALLKLLEDPHLFVRGDAANALLRFKDPKAFDAVFNLLQSSDPDVRFIAVHSLLVSKHPKSSEAFHSVLVQDLLHERKETALKLAQAVFGDRYSLAVINHAEAMIAFRKRHSVQKPDEEKELFERLNSFIQVLTPETADFLSAYARKNKLHQFPQRESLKTWGASAIALAPYMLEATQVSDDLQFARNRLVDLGQIVGFEVLASQFKPSEQALLLEAIASADADEKTHEAIVPFMFSYVPEVLKGDPGEQLKMKAVINYFGRRYRELNDETKLKVKNLALRIYNDKNYEGAATEEVLAQLFSSLKKDDPKLEAVWKELREAISLSP
jgi:HEAT repeat protein